jgi:hypothetical protein
LEEKQIVLEQEWLRDWNEIERQPARNVDEAWIHLLAALDRDIDEFNALKLCGDQQVEVVKGEDSVELRWHREHEPMLTVKLDKTGEVITYSAQTGKEAQRRSGNLRVRPRRGSNAVLYDGRPTPFTYEEASQFLLQPLLMP